MTHRFSHASNVSKLKPITHPIQRLDRILRRAGLLKLAPQITDMAVNRTIGNHPMIGIDPVEQLIPGKHPPGGLGQRAEQAQFQGRQVQGDAIE